MAEWVEEKIDNYVLEVKPATVAALTRSRKTPVIMAFSGGSWCPPCTSLKKVWKELALRVYPLKVATINCDDHREDCGLYNIDGYPTIFLYPNGPDGRRSAIKYNGNPTMQGLVDFVKGNVRGFDFQPKL